MQVVILDEDNLSIKFASEYQNKIWNLLECTSSSYVRKLVDLIVPVPDRNVLLGDFNMPCG